MLGCLTIALLAIARPHAAEAAGCRGGALRPDLIAEPPSYVALQREEGASGPRFLAVFRSGFRNMGRGRLELVGRRPSSSARMRSTQVVDCASGASRVSRDIGRMRYVRRPTHQHWHIKDFARYTLRSLTGTISQSARKAGFCMGDSVDPQRPIAGKPPAPGFAPNRGSACGAGRADALRVREGLSVGWGDAYDPFVEGQFVDLTGMPGGQYRILNEVDPLQRLADARNGNDVAGTDVTVSWPDGREAQPVFQTTGTCEGRAACATSAPSRSAGTEGAARLGRPQPALGGWFTAG